MAILVKHTLTGARFILLGTGFGSQGVEPEKKGYLKQLDVTPEREEHDMVCVCDSEGTIGWCRTSEVQVIEVDGKVPSEHFRD